MVRILTVMSCLQTVFGRPWSETPSPDLDALTETLENILSDSRLEFSNFEFLQRNLGQEKEFGSELDSGLLREKRSIGSQQLRSIKSAFRDRLEIHQLMRYIRNKGPDKLPTKPKTVHSRRLKVTQLYLVDSQNFLYSISSIS